MIAGQEIQTVAGSLARSPVVGVVRTHSTDTARTEARALIDGGLEVVEITFTVPDASALVRELRDALDNTTSPWLGMGSVTNAKRAREAVAAGAQFLVSPNVSPEVAEVAADAELFLVMGAMTPTEIVRASELGADLVKVYPLPGIGGAQYLKTVRGPLFDIDMLAAGGFGVDEIPTYRAAGAKAFGMAAPLLLSGPGSATENVNHAVHLAKGSA